MPFCLVNARYIVKYKRTEKCLNRLGALLPKEKYILNARFLYKMNVLRKF